MSRIDFASELNEQQLKVVTAEDGPVLAIAAAGTGKTRALTYRVAYLVEEKTIDPGRILLLTFTNKAANEMMERANELVGAGVSGLWGGTFHHMANRLLRRHSHVLGFEPGFTILDQDDAKSILKSSMSELKLVGKEYPKPEVLSGIFSLAANKEVSVPDIASDRFENHPLVGLEDLERVRTKYEKKKRELNAMDFDDLLVNGLRLFREDEVLLARYQHLFQYILVDEYQDTNIIQSQWIDLLAEGHRNLLVVGDDFQSIYSWRGANYRNIMEFPDRYPDATTLKLELNYRSVPEILHVANRCIAGNPDQFQKTLTAVREPHKRPALVGVRDGREQARFIIDQIEHLVHSGVRQEDIAILYRAHFHSMELQMVLARAGIPYVITSGVRFFEQAHIKDVCTILRLLVQAGDMLAFNRLLCLLPRLGQKTAAKIWQKLDGRFLGPEMVGLADVESLVPAGARPPWRKIVNLLEEIGREGLRKHPGEIVRRFLDDFYADYAATTFDNYQQRMDDIQEMATFAADYKSIDEFVNEIALLTNIDTGFSASHREDQSGIRLTTVHQAKGLEWKVVFMLWVTDGMFPSARSLNEPGGDAEERRLFYVSVTRAKDELYLCVPEVRRMNDGGYNYCTPSRFVAELPANLLQRQELSVY